MRKIFAGFNIFILLVCAELSSEEINWKRQIYKTVNSIAGIEESEKTQLVSAVKSELRKEIAENETIEQKYLESIGRIICAGLFEEIDYKTISKVVRDVYIAEKNNAPIKEVEDIALIGFGKDITAKQLELSAKALKKLSETKIRPEIYQELISVGLDRDWTGETIYLVSEGLISGYSVGIDPEKLTLGMIIRIEQGLDKKTLQEMINEEIKFIQKEETRKTEEEKRQDAAYKDMKLAIDKGFPSQVAWEVYRIAIENGWSSEIIHEVFNGLIEAQEIGLTPERIATGLILRVEKGFEISAKQMVEEEIAYIKQIEKEKLELSREKVRGLNIPLMEETFKSFLAGPTPYKWGGNTRRGTDCSGFTQAVYLEQGKLLPRVSYQQAQVGKSVDKSELEYGDLVFFNKYGWGGRIDHVGIYMKDGKFIHSARRKGVVITNLNKRYYKAHYAGAKRIFY